MRLRPISFSMLVTTLLCASGGPRSVIAHDSSVTEPPDPCPTRDTEVDVARCQASLPKDWGLSLDRYMELGPLGGPRPPFGDRLLCPGGAEPRGGNVVGSAFATKVSASPLSSFGRTLYAPADEAGPKAPVVSVFSVICPDREFTLYNALSRCGYVCVPRPFALIPMRSEIPYRRGHDLLEQHRHDEAVEAFREAVANGPPSERNTSWLAVALFTAKRPQEAIPQFEAALRMNPGHFWHRLHLGMAHHKAGQSSTYAEILDQLLADFRPSTPEHAKALCFKAHLLAETDPTAGAALKKEACTAGEKGCCPR